MNEPTRALTKVISEEDLRLLEAAYRQLEHPSLAARVSSVVGTPFEIGFRLLPKPWYRGMHDAIERAIARAYDAALSTMHRRRGTISHEPYHRALVAASGAFGGALGFPGLLVELPVTTTIMLRAIAEIAREEGENLKTADARIACLTVFALGGRTEVDDAADTGYYGVRVALAAYMGSVGRQAAAGAIGVDGAPLVFRAIRWVAAPFGIQVAERSAVRLLPVVSALGAATVNVIFIQHFQQMARAHFTVRRLERQYGKDPVRGAYESLKQNLGI